MKNEYSKVPVFLWDQKTRKVINNRMVKVLGEIFGARYGVLKSEISTYGTELNQCHTLLLEDTSGVFHFQCGYLTFDLNKHTLTESKVKEVRKVLSEKKVSK